MSKKIAILLIFNVLSAFILRGQNDLRVLASAGSSVQSGNFEVCYTLGEPIIASGNSASNIGRITGGFQQPPKGKTITGVVKDACSGLPLSNAKAKVETPLDSVLTDANGKFAFEIFSNNTAFPYSFEKTGNKTITAQSYSVLDLKINLGRIVDSNISILACEKDIPYNFKGKPLTQTVDTIITFSTPSATTPDAERCDSVFRIRFKVDLVQKDTIDKVVCSHDVFKMPRSGQTINRSGVFNDTPLLHLSGCDSVTTTYRLDFYHSPVKIDEQEACYGETLRYKNKTFTIQKPTGYDTLRGGAQYGCDSITQIYVNFRRAKAIDDDYSFTLNDKLDTLIKVTANDYISGNFKITIRDSLKIGIAKVISDKDIRLTIPVNLLTETTFSYQICSNFCPTQCNTATVVLKFSRDATKIKGSGDPIVITPDGDGLNDVLIFDGLDLFPSNNLTVVNRWGQQVYYAKPYKNDWGGSNQSGQQLPDGTYFYSMNLELADGKVQWGAITIKRE